jgi:hypothetical protein
MSGARIPASPEGPAHFRDPVLAHAGTTLPVQGSPVARQLPPKPQPDPDSSSIWLVIRAESWQQLKLVALAVLGPASHELGLCYGLAEGGWGIISGLLDLLKMVVLEGLYQEAHQAWSWNPFEWPDYLEGRTADYFLHARMETAHRQFTGLMQQLALAVKDPGKFFGAVWDSEVQSYAVKWQRYKWLIGHRTLTNEFEAGRLEGGVLLEVILLLATVVDGVGLAIKGAKALGEIPELVRLAKTVRSAEEAKAALAARQLEKLRSGTQAMGDAEEVTAGTPTHGTLVFKDKLGGDRPQLPEFNGKTSGVLAPEEPHGPPVPLESGPRTGAKFPYSQADGHVETQGANWMKENGVTKATIYHNNPSGTCGNCDYYLPTYLQEGSQLTVVPPENAVPPTPRWIDVPKTYVGNSKSPY